MNTSENTKMTPRTVKAVFAHLDCLVDGIDAIQQAGIDDFDVTSPLPRHEIEEMLYKGRPSPVRWFTLFGAIFGGVFGFSLCSFTHLNWAMIIPAGKPLVSIPPFMIITFESTVLWGCLFTFVGMIVMARLPGNALKRELEDPRFSDDVFGLVANNLTQDQAANVEAMLQEHGAVEVDNAYTVNAGIPAPPPKPTQTLLTEIDNPNTPLLIRLGVWLTVIIIASVIGVTMYFHHTVATELESQGYSTPERAVTPAHRPND